MAKTPETEAERLARLVKEGHEVIQDLRRVTREAEETHRNMTQRLKVASEKFSAEFLDEIRKTLREAVEPVRRDVREGLVELVAREQIKMMMHHAFELEVAVSRDSGGTGHALRVTERPWKFVCDDD